MSFDSEMNNEWMDGCWRITRVLSACGLFSCLFKKIKIKKKEVLDANRDRASLISFENCFCPRRPPHQSLLTYLLYMHPPTFFISPSRLRRLHRAGRPDAPATGAQNHPELDPVQHVVGDPG